MAAVELPVSHVVAGAPEPGDDPAAAPLDRQHAVARAVGDEEARGAHLPRRRHKARREGQDVGEEVAVADPQGERVGGPVGEPPDGQAAAIHRAAGERLLQGAVDGLHVRAVPAQDDVPGVVKRGRNEQDNADGVREPRRRSRVARASPPAPCNRTAIGAGRSAPWPGGTYRRWSPRAGAPISSGSKPEGRASPICRAVGRARRRPPLDASLLAIRIDPYPPSTTARTGLGHGPRRPVYAPPASGRSSAGTVLPATGVSPAADWNDSPPSAESSRRKVISMFTL